MAGSPLPGGGGSYLTLEAKTPRGGRMSWLRSTRREKKDGERAVDVDAAVEECRMLLNSAVVGRLLEGADTAVRTAVLLSVEKARCACSKKRNAPTGKNPETGDCRLAEAKAFLRGGRC